MKIKSGEHEFEVEIPIERISNIRIQTSVNPMGQRDATLYLETAYVESDGTQKKAEEEE